MTSDDNQQYFITILNSNGEAINITPEILPEQLLPLLQKKQLKEEKVDLTSAYKKIFENLAENNSTSLGSISSLSNIINVNSGNNSRIKLTTSNSEQNKTRDNISSSSIINARSPLQTILLRSSNQNNHNLQSSVSNDHSIIPAGSITDNNSSNYITTLQISQSNPNLNTLAFTQPQALLHYSNQNPDSPNTVLIPISLHNSNQFSQQQILVAAAAVASGGYSQNCTDQGTQNVHTSNSGSHHNLNTTSLAKLISGNVTNPLSINLGNVMKSNSANSDISPNSKSSTHKRKFDINATDEFGRRKEQRLLKNREAARECRRKKKEYVKCLENRVANLEQQNKVLVDEINRMKELYAKKVSKKPSNPPSEVDLKYSLDQYPSSDNNASVVATMKEYYDGGVSNDLDSQHCVSLVNNAGMQCHSKYSVHDLDPSRGPPPTTKRDTDHHQYSSSNKQDNNSQLSVLLAGGNPSFVAHPNIYSGSEGVHDDGEEDDDDDDDDNSPCD